MNRDLFHDFAQLIIALVLLIGAFFFLYKLFFGGTPVPDNLRESLMQVTGGVLGIIGTITGFYLGTSLSSARKDTAAARVTELAMFRRPTQPAPAPASPPPAPPAENELPKAA